MSVGGAGIPRLQELIYVETAAQAVEEGGLLSRSGPPLSDERPVTPWNRTRQGRTTNPSGKPGKPTRNSTCTTPLMC